MQVKKFEAPTLQEALDHVKRELGPEAVILQTKKHKKGYGLLSKTSVEVTAAVSERSTQKKDMAARKLPSETMTKVGRLPAQKQAEVYDQIMDKHLAAAMASSRDKVDFSARQATQARAAIAPAPIAAPSVASTVSYSRPAAPRATAAESVSPPKSSKPITERRYADIEDADSQVSSELEELRSLVKSLVKDNRDAAQKSNSTNPAVEEVYEQLLLAGIDRKNAHSLVKQAEFELNQAKPDADALLDRVAEELMTTTETLSWLGAEQQPKGAPRVLTLIGPTGVGKTTTLAKIASDAILKKNMKVGLINFDSYKVAAFDQLATYAKILKVPFRSAASEQDLLAAVADFSGLDLILIDTTGRSQRDPGALQEMEKALRAIPSIETALVLASTTRDAELHDSATRFQMMAPRGIIFSKLDEATTFGCVYNVSQRAKLPLLYFTTGQRVPEDLEDASRERLAALVLGL